MRAHASSQAFGACARIGYDSGVTPKRRPKKKPPKNPAAAALAKLRWQKTSPKERSESASKAADARWQKAKRKPE